MKYRTVLTSTITLCLSQSVWSTLLPDTGQTDCYNANGSIITCPNSNSAFYGQDAQYQGNAMNYTDNGNGTVTDNNTGLLWEQAHHATRLSFYDAEAVCESLNLGGHTGWRLPNLKELFSLADFTGNQHAGQYYLDNDYFDLEPPDVIDDNDQFSTHTVQMMGQTWSSIIYTGDHWNNPNMEAAFFFNFLDGHIKQAPTTSDTELFYRCVYGNEYGANDFIINDDDTVTDQSTGLIWQHQDDGIGRDWQDSLAYCEGLELAGQTDWRLPNIKELQTIVDYTRSDPAIDPTVFTLIDSEGWFWSSTTHGDATLSAAYICFGKCDSKDGVDTHGAGAQRADPKSGDPDDYPNFGGAQDDDVRIYNYSRCVRDAEITTITDSDNDGIADSSDNCPNTANASQADSDGDGIGDACDSTNTQEEPSPIYRFWSSTNRAHFFTINETEKNYIIATYPEENWKYGGIAYNAYKSTDYPEGTSPVYRFWSSINKAHFFTINEAEKDMIIATYPEENWKYGGVAWYAYKASDAPEGTIPVYRFYSALNKTHFFTANETEKNYIIATYPEENWKYGGIAWYAYE